MSRTHHADDWPELVGSAEAIINGLLNEPALAEIWHKQAAVWLERYEHGWLDENGQPRQLGARENDAAPTP